MRVRAHARAGWLGGLGAREHIVHAYMWHACTRRLLPCWLKSTREPRHQDGCFLRWRSLAGLGCHVRLHLDGALASLAPGPPLSSRL